MLNIGPQELLIVLVIALIVVGPQRLPELSRQIGKGLREFRKVQDDVKGMVKFDLDEEPAKPTPRASSPTAPRPAGPHRTARPAPVQGTATANGSGATADAPAVEPGPDATSA